MRPFLGLVVLAGCATRGPLEATAFQPHPRRLPPSAEAPSMSARLDIYTPAFNVTRVRNSAQLVAVTRDLVRVHLGLRFYDAYRDMTVWIEDENGRRYDPVAREGARIERLALAWWNLPADGACRVWSGRRYGYPTNAQLEYLTADYVFRSPGLMAPERKSVILHVDLPYGRSLRYVWNFVDGTFISHWYFRRDDADLRCPTIPGLASERVGVRSAPDR